MGENAGNGAVVPSQKPRVPACGLSLRLRIHIRAGDLTRVAHDEPGTLGAGIAPRVDRAIRAERDDLGMAHLMVEIVEPPEMREELRRIGAELTVMYGSGART